MPLGRQWVSSALLLHWVACCKETLHSLSGKVFKVVPAAAPRHYHNPGIGRTHRHREQRPSIPGRSVEERRPLARSCSFVLRDEILLLCRHAQPSPVPLYTPPGRNGNPTPMGAQGERTGLGQRAGCPLWALRVGRDGLVYRQALAFILTPSWPTGLPEI
ncbi:hypothetical protein E2C01_005482 [Portunus trituberculatus]|uniref:Secreted protein n=1 Tax=Portunus trituberculatus TaxID=210409 RepID=A0A5B7CVM7_PORTR|nr:hypothetical protein [Portunus trituberculatus]